MKMLLVNSVCGVGSTGRITADIAEAFIKKGHVARVAYGRGQVPEKYKDISYRIGNGFRICFNALKARLLDNEGFNARKETKKFIKWADEYNPDVLWLHNLHGYYINIDILFNWIKSRPQMEVKWTLHDCWAFTGHCSHFSIANCNKWQNQCECCLQKKCYPKSLLRDNSKHNFNHKQKLFSGVKNMSIIVPSYWLADLVQKSFLTEYEVDVVHNTINEDIFKLQYSDFKQTYNLYDKIVILGVANIWTEQKGLTDFIELAKLLSDKYVIVLVGSYKTKNKKIPRNIIFMPRTNSEKDLAKIYAGADVFVNPSREETFGLTTLEAIKCGTPTIVYKDTACEEVARLYGGIVVEPNVADIYKAITNM